MKFKSALFCSLVLAAGAAVGIVTYTYARHRRGGRR